MYAAKILGIEQGSDEGLKKAFWKITIVAGILCGLISLSNFSTAGLLFLTIMAMMFIGRVRLRYLAFIVAAGIAMMVALYFLAGELDFMPSRFDTFRGRMERFIHGDPAAGAYFHRRGSLV